MRQILPKDRLEIGDSAIAHTDSLLNRQGRTGVFMREAAVLADQGLLNYDTARELSHKVWPEFGWPATAVRRLVAIGALRVDRSRKRRERAPIESVPPEERCATCSRRRDAPFSECDRCYGNRVLRLGLHLQRCS